jgi:DNA-directed RNA polymerase specialized sigma24 family protein
MLGSVFDADDALQEALFRAWRGVDSLRSAASARAWLYAIATNVCLTEESARMPETSVASVNSALQRARSAISARMPARSQQANLQSLDDREPMISSTATSPPGNGTTLAPSRRC